MKYILLPLAAWVIAGSLKFLINSIRYGRAAREHIGYGGFPSTHTTVLAAVTFAIGFSEGFSTPLFMLAEGALVILVIDAHGLRRKVGEQARVLNRLELTARLREKMGHSYAEIAGGLALGAAIGYVWAGL